MYDQFGADKQLSPYEIFSNKLAIHQGVLNLNKVHKQGKTTSVPAIF